MDYKTLKNIVSLKQNKHYPNLIDVEINSKSLKSYNDIEMSMVFYPYSRIINANDIHILPYEEYVNDVNRGSQSAYKKLVSSTDKAAGIFLSVLIIAIFALLKPEDIISIESIVSIFGAYVIGKELWIDIDNSLINATYGKKLSWQENTFNFIRQYTGTIQQFMDVARRHRYLSDTINPTKIDYVEYSNSKSIELQIKRNDLKRKPMGKSVHLMTIKINKDLLKEFDRKGYMFGMKINFVKGFAAFKFNTEVFQGLENGELGVISKSNEWEKNSILIRKTMNIGRLKYYHSVEIIKSMKLIKSEK